MTDPALSPWKIPFDPTAQQRAASDPLSSVWVNASAGSGKTTILTNRVTRLLLSGVKPEKILCLTFTRAAAAEMAIRINEKLSHWAVCSDNELSANLGDLQGRTPTVKEMTQARRLFAEAIACPGGMRIRTLHAFGQEVLRRFPVESGLAPHFTVIEENDARTMQEDCLDDLLRDAATDSESALAQGIVCLINRLGEQAFRSAARNVLREKMRLDQALAHHGSLRMLTQHLHAKLNLEPDDTEQSIINSAFGASVFDENKMRETAKKLLQGKTTAQKRGATILEWLEYEPRKRTAHFKDYVGCFLKADGHTYKDYADKDLRARHPDLETILLREATRLQSLNERLDAVDIASTTTAILLFSQALIARYSARKKAQAALDYDDLVHETLKLLKRPGIAPWVLHKLDDGLDHLLVDEAQDTSRAQWEVVEVLAEEFFAGKTARDDNRTLFVVGDEKQSIYSFQNADPEAFAAMRVFFENKIRKAEKKWQEIPLCVSFRSAPVVLRAVDAIFSHDLAANGVSADIIRHEAFKRDQLFGRVELWPLIPKSESKKDETRWELPIGYEDEHDPQAVLATQIANIIQGWLINNEVLPGTDQPIRPGDIMILLRRRGRFASLMVRALKQNDIPVTGVDRMRLMEQLPVMDLLALAQFTLLPEDDLNLATILRGPLINISENDLMNLAARRGEKSLWQNLKSSYAHQETHDYLSGWLNGADFMSPFAMLSKILNQPCPASSISGRHAIWSRLGLDALDPIEELLNAAQNFSRRQAPSLQHFLHWLTSSNSEIKRALDSGEKVGAGQVRIMTVHASKGLEAPIVFLPDTANVPRVNDVPNFLWDESGLLPFYLASKPKAGAARNIWDRARTKQMQEYRRLLYVALTRASHRLYIGGWELSRNEADSDASWYNLAKNGLKESETHAQNTNGAIVWEDPPLASANGNTPVKLSQANIILLPEWARTKTAVEEASPPSVAPSRLGMENSTATPDAAFTRGRIIHRLLQSLPDIQDDKRTETAKRFLSHPHHHLDHSRQDEILDEVLRLLQNENFAPLFGPNSRAEVPLAGKVNGKNFSGQVDRMVVLDREIWIVDYKTNRPPPSDASGIPDDYRQQMEAYRAIMGPIYPTHKIRCFLLWTYAPVVMELPEFAA